MVTTPHELPTVRDTLTSARRPRMLAGWTHNDQTETSRPLSNFYGHGLDRQRARYWPLAVGTSPLLANVFQWG